MPLIVGNEGAQVSVGVAHVNDGGIATLDVNQRGSGRSGNCRRSGRADLDRGLTGEQRLELRLGDTRPPRRFSSIESSRLLHATDGGGGSFSIFDAVDSTFVGLFRN